jgi:mono/diheme cytochrome c family protein
MRQALCTFVCICGTAAVLTAAALAQSGGTGSGQAGTPPPTAAIHARQLLDTYCVNCHGSRTRAGGVALDGLSLDAVPQDAVVWEKALRKLRGRQMPPPGSPQPAQREIDTFVTWMEARLDAPGGPSRSGRMTAGHVPIQRLTRTEFAAAANDLLGIELDAELLLPSEIEVHGFDNIAAALSISPAFLDQYVAAARLAARLAVGEPAPKVANAFYPRPDGDQAVHVDGLPLGTRGGMKFRHHFPADGEYRFTLADLGIDLYTRVTENRHTVVLQVDGREVFRESLGGDADRVLIDRGGAPARAEAMKRFTGIPVQVKAGTRDVAVAFIERARIESDEFVQFLPGDEFSRGDRMARIVGGVRVEGPFDSPGVSDTPSRRKVFVCQPASPDAAAERACARRIGEQLARRAFRRPVTGADVDSLMPHFDAGRSRGFDAGIEHLVAAVLVSPDFLFRTIRPPASAAATAGGPAGTAAAAFPLTDLELASRLSFFLWSQGPDDELLSIASAGKLRTAGARRRCGCSPTRAPGAWSAISRSSGWTSTTSTRWSRTRTCFPPSTTSSARIWRPRSSRSSPACCSASATSANCSPPTTPS